MWILSKTSLSKWIKAINCKEHLRFQDQGRSGLKRSVKIKKFEANLILALIHFNWIEKGSSLSQFDLIFMGPSVVSGKVVRAGDPREIDQAKSSLGQRFDRQLYPTSAEVDNPSLTLMIHFLTAQYCCPDSVIRKVQHDDLVLIHAKYIYL